VGEKTKSQENKRGEKGFGKEKSTFEKPLANGLDLKK